MQLIAPRFPCVLNARRLGNPHFTAAGLKYPVDALRETIVLKSPRPQGREILHPHRLPSSKLLRPLPPPFTSSESSNCRCSREPAAMDLAVASSLLSIGHLEGERKSCSVTQGQLDRLSELGYLPPPQLVFARAGLVALYGDL